MVRGAKQHGLLAKIRARLAVLENPLDHVIDLRRLVAHRGQIRPLARAPLREQGLREALGRQPHDAIRGLEDRLGRAVVLLELDHPGRRLEQPRKVENVARTRRAKAVDRLRVVADDGEAVAAGPELE